MSFDHTCYTSVCSEEALAERFGSKRPAEERR